MRRALPGLALALGAGAYCLVLLASRDAPLFHLRLLGIASLILVSASLGALWHSPGTVDAEE